MLRNGDVGKARDEENCRRYERSRSKLFIVVIVSIRCAFFLCLRFPISIWFMRANALWSNIASACGRRENDVMNTRVSFNVRNVWMANAKQDEQQQQLKNIIVNYSLRFKSYVELDVGEKITRELLQFQLDFSLSYLDDFFCFCYKMPSNAGMPHGWCTHDDLIANKCNSFYFFSLLFCDSQNCGSHNEWRFLMRDAGKYSSRFSIWK